MQGMKVDKKLESNKKREVVARKEHDSIVTIHSKNTRHNTNGSNLSWR